ncbi:hypothetical protein [Pseudonocardia lacus]|uniref:hypothetical protein n=1 Tax=Pseudonocardia lacus TaxID=2835865 RepID=UPI001BDC2E80|nr:hypothetical protein [Pseudonocardia lacus]
MAEMSAVDVVIVEEAVCRHCSTSIERAQGGFWRHRRSSHARSLRQRCAPGTRNAQMADAEPGSVRRVA